MTITKPTKKIALQTQANDFAPIISYVRSGPDIWVERSFSYRNPSLSSRSHARRMANLGGDSNFLRVDCESTGAGRFYWNFIFSVKTSQLEQV